MYVTNELFPGVNKSLEFNDTIASYAFTFNDASVTIMEKFEVSSYRREEVGYVLICMTLLIVVVRFFCMPIWNAFWYCEDLADALNVKIKFIQPNM